MSKLQKTNNLYSHPFSKAYWREASLELKDVHMLAVAALMIALRVALKSVSIPIAPNLRINVAAPLINALGAMIFGPVVAIPAAFVSDTLGCILFPQGAYFFPCAFVEVAGSVLFALFFYRAKVTVTRVMLGKSYAAMVLPAAIKNLCMFPIEAFMLALFFGVLIPITYRSKLTYDANADGTSLKFTVKQCGLLLALFAVGVAAMVGYLFYHYDTNSLSASYTTQERYEANCSMIDYVKDATDEYDNDTLVTTIESAYKKFMRHQTTYNVAVYKVDEAALANYDKDLETIRGMSKSKAKAVASDGVMEAVGTATIVVDTATNQVISFSMK